MTSLGDLNRDGFRDVAIGAPYEARGAIYIYLGSADGLSTEPSQVRASYSYLGLVERVIRWLMPVTVISVKIQWCSKELVQLCNSIIPEHWTTKKFR